MDSDNIKNLVSFFFEAATLRRIPRAHQQALFTVDSSDNIASHSYLVALISYFLAESLKANSDIVVKMAILHDIGEARTGDRNWIRRKYVSTEEEPAREDQLKNIKSSEEALKLSKEYEKQESLESKIVKDADYLAQILILREYALQGNKEAERWLNKPEKYTPEKSLNTDPAKKIALEIRTQNPGTWWENFVFDKNQK